MNHIHRAIGCGCLALLAAPTLNAQDPIPRPSIRLASQPATHTLQLQSTTRGTAFLVLGQMLPQSVQFNNVALDVAAQFLLPLGEIEAFQSFSMFVPRGLRELYAEALILPPDFTIYDSNVVSLADAADVAQPPATAIPPVQPDTPMNDADRAGSQVQQRVPVVPAPIDAPADADRAPAADGDADRATIIDANGDRAPTVVNPNADRAPASNTQIIGPSDVQVTSSPVDTPNR
jgi:hypothetical protein